MLAVWLPLLGNLKNQGLCTVTQSSGTPVWLDNGKIGQGLSLNSRVGFSCPSLSGCKKFTVAFWVKIEDNPAITTNWLDVFRFNDQKADNSSTGYLRAETNYGNTSTGVHWHDNATNAIASSLPTHYSGNRGIWKHCVLTVDSDVEIKAYTDGVLVDTKSTSNGGHITGTFYIGESGVIGCMNDVRIWKDQILSDDKIYELSRGLIAWFPLSPRPVYKITGDNIFTTSNIAKANSSSSYSVSAISNTSFRLYTNKNVAYASTKQTVSSLGLTVGKRYRMKCKIDITRLDTRIIVGLRDSNNTYRASTGSLYEGGIYEYEFVLTSDMSYLSFLGTYESSQCDITFSDIEIYELQEENIVYDISGYQHNGIKNNISYDSDTVRNTGCSVFNGSNSYIKVVNNDWMIQGSEEMTINFWAYSNDWTTETDGGRMISCTETGGFNLEGGASGYVRFSHHVYTNAEKSATGYIYNNSGIKLSTLTAGWHMFTLVYTLSGEKIYIDGVLHSSSTTVSYGLHFNTSARLYLGCEANTANPKTPYFNGKMSDFRLYYTELSAEYIAKLYGLITEIQEV